MNWRKELNKTERNHFWNDAKCRSLKDFMETRECQKALDSKREVCWECRNIALKLGVEK